MLFAELLQRRAAWRFDLTSALIGAIVAWLLAGFLYSRRAGIRAFGQKLWAPVANWRRRMQSSEEEKYLNTLQEALKSLLLFKPDDPRAIFQPPAFLASPPIPTAASRAGRLPPPLEIPFSTLADGHKRIIMTGSRASGCTTALAMTVWQSAGRAGEIKPYQRIPVWIDLARLKDLPEGSKSTPQERLVQLALQFMPGVLPKWLLSHLRNEPALILVDNWETLAPDARNLVALWIAEVAQDLPDSCWIIACGQEGYGPLVEVGFVPLELVPASGVATVASLYSGWATLLKADEQEPPEEVLQALVWADQAGATLLELSLRTVVYLQTQHIPNRPVDVLDFFLDSRIPEIDLGEGQEETSAQARMLALTALGHIARTHRLEGRVFSRQDMFDYISSLLPPEEERPPKLEGAVRKLLNDADLLKRDGKSWSPVHCLWEDFLTAWTLVEDEVGADFAKAHLHDPTWSLLLEFYVGLADATPLVQSLLQEAETHGDYGILLRLARWSAVAPEDAPWRKAVIKALAQAFMAQTVDKKLRLRIGRALAITAGEGARAFFIQALRHPSVDIRCGALRGLGWTGAAREIAVLSAAMKDTNLETRQSAAEALGDMATPGAVRVLSDALNEADEHLILSIATALAKIPKGHPVLKESAESADLLIRRAAAHGLGLIHEAWARELLTEMSREDSEWLVRSAAEMALAAEKEHVEAKIVVPPPPQVDQLDWLITWAASQGLGLGVGNAAMDTLIRAVAEGDSDTKVLGALTLAEIGQEKHLAVLQPLLEDEEPAVQRAATNAVRRIEKRYHIYTGL